MAHARRIRRRRTAQAGRGNNRAPAARSVGRLKIPPRLLGEIFPAAFRGRTPAVGIGAFVVVSEALGETHSTAAARIERFTSGRRAARLPIAAMEKAARQLRPADLTAVASVLAACGSSHRLAILMILLEGPATYRAIQRRTSLKAGPLYHHIGQLRLTGLIGPKTRDLYVLTQAGLRVLLTILCMERLIHDTSPRALPGG